MRALLLMMVVAFLSPSFPQRFALAQSGDAYSRDEEEEEDGGAAGNGGTRGCTYCGFNGGGWSTYGNSNGGYVIVPDTGGPVYVVPAEPAPPPPAPPATAAPDTGTSTDVAALNPPRRQGRATRIFAGPGMFPPEYFAAYAIIAFKSRPLPQDRNRFLNICHGYVAAILAYSEIQVPLDQQLVTVWPVNQDYVAIRTMEQEDLEGCEGAVDEYGLGTSLTALNDARAALPQADIDTLQSRRGPFVLAWSPTAKKGAADALILRMDMSDVETATQAREKFEAWRDEIEAKQDLWIDGWKEDTLADTIGNWADRWGAGILSFLGKG